MTSDQHLGYDNSNAADFKNFLTYISGRDDVQSLILLGDTIDMWRRDVSGIFLEFFNIVNQLLILNTTKKVQVFIVAGNHDYHLLKLLRPGYYFRFYEELPDPSLQASAPTIPSFAANQENGGAKYKFKHGWEFDLAQSPIIMEALCHNMSDEAGHLRSSIYQLLQTTKDYFGRELKEIIDYHSDRGGFIENLLIPPEKRLEPYITDVEKKAYSSVNDGETLVFGHTHRPFVSKDRRLVNTGSWVKDATIFNTFVELDGKDVKLFQFRSEGTPIDITDKQEYSFT